MIIAYNCRESVYIAALVKNVQERRQRAQNIRRRDRWEKYLVVSLKNYSSLPAVSEMFKANTTLLPMRRAGDRGREVPGLDATLADYIAEAVEADAA